jgi:hypothetical protein
MVICQDLAHVKPATYLLRTVLSKNELICLALVEFARRHRLALAEQFQQEDIAWALRQKEATQE